MRILIIDDDPGIRGLIKAVLTRRGHDVTEASDGREGLAGWEASAPDLVVTDVQMPGLGGIDMIRDLRRRGSPAKILIVSGKRAPLDEELSAMREEGRLGVLDKPFTPAELVASVQALADRDEPLG